MILKKKGFKPEILMDMERSSFLIEKKEFANN